MSSRFHPASIVAVAAAAAAFTFAGVAGPALADDANPFTFATSATTTAVTVDLSSTTYSTQPTNGLYISALRNGCTGTPCWAEDDADLGVAQSGINGTYTLTGLRPNTVYDVRVLAYGVGTSDEFVTTSPDVNAAPSAYPYADASSDGIHAVVAAEAEYDTWNINDGGTIANLRYNVYA